MDTRGRSLSIWDGKEETLIRRVIDQHRSSLFVLKIALLVALIGTLMRIVDEKMTQLPWVPENSTFVLLGALTGIGLGLSLYRVDKCLEVFHRWKVVSTNNGLRETSSGVPNRKMLIPGFKSVSLWVDGGSRTESEWRSVTKGLSQGFGFPNCEVKFGRNMATVKLKFYFKSGFLDKPAILTEPPAIDYDKVSVPVGRDDFGNTVAIVFRNNSGLLIGGLPGSGKTALLNTLLLPLVKDDRFRVSVIDGKGGFDLQRVGLDADLYMRDSEDFEGVRDVLSDARDRMLDKLNTPSATPNFWDRPLSKNDPLEIIVLDEAQNFFDSSSGRTKDEKKIIEEITALVRDLVKRGRSAGIFVLLASQKPTSEAIPTSIRDNCGVRICLRVTTQEAAKSVLGAAVATDVSPVDIPASRIGGMVIAKESGQVVMARAYYVDPNLE